jgi:hypothetical protein
MTAHNPRCQSSTLTHAIDFKGYVTIDFAASIHWKRRRKVLKNQLLALPSAE